ncbi:tRNA (adenosine(37)-N6)-threonylcarbamoyltransferase complex ATPase subunit type 1 TsaE [Pseudalkalibacillus salsuginis]|uniref:tRNA (adenosine(37)-N6)-threonylcarbamoyltransferase complex ATPase subunit type 1 TsaE n=1 Tax=Pseudalkalibacillus salsuginis TaxID=2910972 RepID=UPI001F014CB2|nr:tRNA (adenosine(37)-N6)-threonylcarbamoyltransferase complex ATPase subunit type 1 TsaE [Pseudalkalibacillus salsuginis]MCF6411480.1 tRNA (adenosine(37)-N6)-threonylcarbamoyltransferase complex ATPase subunit type 1 TsaE [Pseudalkalibacillus salsuginis]
MEQLQFRLKSPEETVQLGARLAEHLEPGDVITLEGDLGAGKTTFTKGLAKGLHINRVVKSPTFTIIREYKGRLPLYHMDVYRLEDSDEDLGFDEYFEGEGVTVVEWAHLIKDYLPEDRLAITIRLIDEDEREMTIEPIGDRANSVCEEFRNESISD